ncbi:cytochrome-c oxidase, cbb3-type subunit III [Oleiagrimonas sp. MCCC 1A03011]|uniref:cytochrome-c oxidase, cbb3-type subunit III n=1 Tax=Oleiagrimonas sp. MCCC 1A03011 TaxID=1926883 RepID=UPI000DC36433|nr:cytochrome-c oxidase, cbb3-type subunit III [Oleiagrimonas sp. MCCC 1A03011]RAP57360.1 cytochrome-c oxidase, cbb3-type subunit III [Oleiagrimonas sp. MCCC 1A03011]
MSTFWSIFVMVLVTINVVGAVWLLFGNAKSDPSETTGHTWDENLTEYNKPLPMWWIGLFVLSVAFGIGYLVLYPGFGATKGSLDWSSVKQHDAHVAAANARLEKLFAQFRDIPMNKLVDDPKALSIGHNVFANNCAMCHGSDARGARGFPNLTDNDWLYGGNPQQVITTITHGRNGVMPAWGAVAGDQGVTELANYVRELSGQSHDATLATAGKARYMTLCIACHGPTGKGNQALGAPNLTDNTWLYGGDLATIEATIRNGRNGQMPAWDKTLGPDRIRMAAAWVLAQSQQAPADTAEAAQ